MKLSPSTADVPFTRKLAENLAYFRNAVGRAREPIDFSWLFDELEEYDRLLERYSGRRLLGARVLEIGYGARPHRMMALFSMGVDAVGVDAEVPLLGLGVGELREVYRRNGAERLAKSFVRRILFDRHERSALAAELRRCGYTPRLDPGRLLVSDAATLELPDASFDLIVSEDVFEHIAEPSLHALVPAMGRWLKPGGLALIRPNVFTGITGGHLAEWNRRSLVRPPTKRQSEPWEHLRKRRLRPNTSLNELSRSAFRELFAREFEILDEVVRDPDLGREYLTAEAARELHGYPEEELFSNRVLFVLRRGNGRA